MEVTTTFDLVADYIEFTHFEGDTSTYHIWLTR